jgi:hypothetical protein
MTNALSIQGALFENKELEIQYHPSGDSFSNRSTLANSRY